MTKRSTQIVQQVLEKTTENTNVRSTQVVQQVLIKPSENTNVRSTQVVQQSLRTIAEAPVITGSPMVSVALSATAGNWTGLPSPVYQWKNNGTPISGATASTYTPVTGDIGATITVTVFGITSAGVGPVAPFSFTPVVLVGLIGWWDTMVTASLGLTGSNVDSVADQSGGGQTLTWSMAKPTYNATGLNSRPTINFVAGQALRKDTFPMGTGNSLTWFYVGTIGSVNGRILSYGGLGQSFDYSNAGSWLFNGLNSNGSPAQFYRNYVPVQSAVTAHPAIHRFIGTITAAGAMVLYIDGVQVATGTSAGNWINNGSFNVGRNAFATTELFTGIISEIGVATGYSDASTVAALDNYLYNKWFVVPATGFSFGWIMN